MKISCILVDDEQPARDELRFLLSRYEDLDIVGEADTVDKAIATIVKSIPDLVFLDIQLAGRNGFEVASAISGMKKPPLFVFATAYDQYAVKAFEENAVDYLLKPISEKRLELTFNRIRKQLSESSTPQFPGKLEELLQQMSCPKTSSRISVENNGRIHIVCPEDIVYCAYEDNRILVHTRDEAHPLYGIGTMDRLAEHLGESSFFRIHRALLVNIDAIREFSPWFNGKYNLIMNDAASTELTVSRTRVKAFKQQLGL